MNSGFAGATVASVAMMDSEEKINHWKRNKKNVRWNCVDRPERQKQRRLESTHISQPAYQLRKTLQFFDESEKNVRKNLSHKPDDQQKVPRKISWIKCTLLATTESERHCWVENNSLHVQYITMNENVRIWSLKWLHFLKMKAKGSFEKAEKQGSKSKFNKRQYQIT